MAYEQNDNSGSLFQAKDKKTDKHPDREGSAKIDGKEYWVNGWIKQDRNGKAWLSLSFKPKEQPARQAPPDINPPMGNAPQARRASLDDDVPF